MRALIIAHGESRAAVTGARGLGLAGWEVGVISDDRRGLVNASRHVSRYHAAPSPEHDLEGWVTAMRDAVRAGGYDFAFPTEDPHVMALSSRRADIGPVAPYADHPVVLRAFDKLGLDDVAAQAGVRVPRTEEATDAVLDWWDGPAVVKARLHATLKPGAPGYVTAAVVEDAAAAREHAVGMRAVGATPVIQELIEGHNESLAAVVDREGRMVACLQHRTERLNPATGGITAYARTVPVDPGLRDRVGAMLAALGWLGLTEIEFRVPADGSPPAMIDFNGRYYGSIALCLRAGINLPGLWADVAAGRPVGAYAEARAGHTYQWFEGDLRSSLSTDGPAGALRALRRAWGAGHSVASLRDPRPGLRMAGRVARRVRRNTGGRGR